MSTQTSLGLAWLEPFNQLAAKQTELQPLTPYQLEKQPDTLLKRAELAQTLAGLGEVTGWLQETSRVLHLHQQQIEIENLPLMGEWFRAHHHWILDYNGLNAAAEPEWLLHHFTAEKNSNTASHAAEVTQHTMLGAQHNTSLNYLKFWALDADGAPAVQLALFNGFSESL